MRCLVLAILALTVCGSGLNGIRRFGDVKAEYNGFGKAMFGGSTQLEIWGEEIDSNLGSNQIVLQVLGIPGISPYIVKKLTQDNEFNSNPDMGKIQFDLPPLNVLLDTED